MSDTSTDGTVQCPRCGGAAERVEYVLVDPAAQHGKRTFECKNEECWQARIIRSVDTGSEQ